MTSSPSQSSMFSQGFRSFEKEALNRHNQAFADEMQEAIQATLDLLDISILLLAISCEGVIYESYGRQKIQLTLCNGYKVKVSSPVSRLIPKKGRGRPRKRKKNIMRHFGLEMLGFIERKSPAFVSRVVRNAASANSFDMARKNLEMDGINIAASTIAKMTYNHADRLMPNRPGHALDGAEKQAELKLHICIDGGRIRMKEFVKLKNKVRKKGSFQGNWREPILFTIHCVNEKGELVKVLNPSYDATMGNWDKAFKLLESWLKYYNLAEAKQITFCADGGTAIWPRVAPMMARLGVKNYSEIVDYMHAKQHANEIIDHIASRNLGRDVISETVHDLLWQGKIDEILVYAQEMLKPRSRALQSVKAKINGYFLQQKRFQYQSYKEAGINIGSGYVESAIRRVINLKLKSNGTFWKQDNCERVLYLRCQLLTGRWKNLDDSIDEMRFKSLNENKVDASEIAA